MRRLLAAAATIASVAAVLAMGLLGCGGDDRGYRVRAIFDNAPVNVGADVLVSGVPVGRVDSLDVTPDHKAAVTLVIFDRRFVPFHADARCGNRQQTLIGERAVTCEVGTQRAPALETIRGGEAAGAHLLPVSRTYGAVDLDLLTAIYRRPTDEQLTILLNELGAGIAARGPELARVIRRASPALGETTRVIRLLAEQRDKLAELAVAGHAVLGPLARDRRSIADAIRATQRAAAAGADRDTDLDASLARLPGTLRSLRGTMEELARFAERSAPVFRDVAAGAPELGKATAGLAPFARQARPTLVRLGQTTQRLRRELPRTNALSGRLVRLGRGLSGPARQLAQLATNLRSANAIPNLLSVLYGGANAGNGYDATSHYLRGEILSGACGQYTNEQFFGCDSQFGEARAASRRRGRAFDDLADYLLGTDG